MIRDIKLPFPLVEIILQEQLLSGCSWHTIPWLFKKGVNLKPKYSCLGFVAGFPGSSAGTEIACNAGDAGSIPGLGIPLEKGQATHSGILGLPWWLRW